MAPAAELARPPRIPKLTYRNPLPTAGDSSLDLNLASSDSLEHPKLNFSPFTLTPPPTPKSTREFDTSSTKSSESTSLASSNGSSSRDSKASSTKKKKTGVLNFLTLKEPSQTALEQFADAQRKQNAAKSGQSIHSVATAKLPPTVPKVNSKWDGVPQSVKSSQSSTRSSKRDSTWSAAPSHRYSRQPMSSPIANTSTFSVATQQSRGAPNSLASPTASMFDISERSDSLSSSSKPLSRSDSPSTSSLPETTSRRSLDSFTCSGALPVSHADHPWSPPPHPYDSDPSLTFLTTFDDKLAIAEPDLAHSTEVDAIFRKLKGGPTESHAHPHGAQDPDPDVPDTHDFLFDVHPIATEPPTRVPDSHSPSPAPVLRAPPAAPTPATHPGIPTAAPAPPAGPAPRPAANFSRPRPVQSVSAGDAPRVFVPPRGSSHAFPPSTLDSIPPTQSPSPSMPPPPLPPRHHSHARHKPSAPSLPTLYEVSIASTENLPDDADDSTSDAGSSSTAVPRASTDSADSSFAPSIAPSVAPSVATSVTPSVMSASWYRSPQERLGLGGRLRKTDVLPWEREDRERGAGKAKKSRLSIFSRG